MVNNLRIVREDSFIDACRKLDNSIKIKVKKQILKIIDDPLIGKPMRHTRKGTREVYVKPFRLSYKYLEDENKVLLLDIYHKDKQ